MRATVRATVAPLLSEGRPSATQISQLLRGHHADVLDRTGDWLRLHGVDKYDGWCHAGYLNLTAATDAEPLPSAWESDLRMSTGCTVRQPGGTQITLPLGALLDPGEVVLSGLAINGRGRVRYFARDAQLIVRRSLDMFSGAPYQWGGVTPWGADCSGLVQTIFALHGLQLPRDAWQQADLLFFSDRDDKRVTHVALSIGGPSVAHCALANGGFAVNAMNADDPVSMQLQKTFLFARRLL
jgi:gamma-D-glutamyl-L-lysine dipeptidyl-peptidase